MLLALAQEAKDVTLALIVLGRCDMYLVCFVHFVLCAHSLHYGDNVH